MDVSCLKSLRVLIIWYSGINTVDLTPLLELEIVVCGYYCNYSGGGEVQQTVTVRAGVVKKVFDNGGN